jgi:hypothetical protein
MKNYLGEIELAKKKTITIKTNKRFAKPKAQKKMISIEKNLKYGDIVLFNGLS